MNRKLGILSFLVAASVGGYWLITLIPQVAAEYQKATEFSRAWGYLYLGVVTVAAVSFLSLALSLLWMLGRNTRSKRARRRALAQNPSQMSPAQLEREIEGHLNQGQTLADDATLPAELRAPIRQSVEELRGKLERQTLHIAAFGTISSGKSSVLNALAGRDIFRTDPKGGTTVNRNEIPWPGADRVVLVDTPGLAEIDGAEREAMARLAARDADLVLFVVDGPLKDFEFRLLEQLGEMEKRILVCLNKQDWYRQSDRALLVDQISDQLSRIVSREDVVAVQASAAGRTRVRVLPDGTQAEETVESEADIRLLAQRMMAVVKHDGRDLLLANLLLRSRGMVDEAKQHVRTALDARAHEIVERSMWQAGGAAALSPLPLIDVAAAMAISTKMVFELARVYRQSIDFETAGRLVSELGKNLVSICGATMATPAIGSAVASLLKTVPGVGTIAGGVLQGLVQALVTRWIGHVFIAYFRAEMREPPQGWAALARAKWIEVTRPADLANLVRAGLKRLGPKQP